MKKIVAGLLLLAGLLSGFWWVNWQIPIDENTGEARNPNYAALAKAAADLPVPDAYLRYYCHEYTDKAACPRASVKDWAVGAQSYLVVPHVIPDLDCQLMAMALKQGAGLKTDGGLYKRPDGKMNCDFSRFGIKHIAYPEKPEGYQISGPVVSEYIGSREEYEVSIRDNYVQQPVYGALKMRARVDYGWNSPFGSGGMCIFNRYSGQWRLEKPCEMTWVA